MRLLTMWTVSVAFSVAVASCGGKVIVDEAVSVAAGSGGSQTSSSGVSSSSGTVAAVGSTGSASECTAITADYMMKLDAARACAPTLDIVQRRGRGLPAAVRHRRR